MTRHLLDIASLTVDELRHIISLSVSDAPLKEKPLADKGVALIFEKPSNRTRHSMEMAVVALGGHPVYTRGEEVGFDTRESVEDIARIMAGYHGVLAARVFSHSVVERMAAVSSVPVVNMLSDQSHPLQALADILTMEEHCGAINDLTVAWIGDYNNVARSLGEAVCKLGGTYSLGCPDGYNASATEIARLSAFGGSVRQSIDAVEAITGAHVVHTDTWISMGQEDESAARRVIFAPYCVDAALMAHAAPNAKFMHCMPAHRGEEVSAEVFDGSSSLVIQQGHHRLTAARGALAWVMGK
ncbi:MAG: ornithine carbamoyltransferase [Actinomycetota bacterium]